jgi:2-polyprenyl-6-methoxyphenol hydroxylase-like FAD-dependent oxidoreductase
MDTHRDHGPDDDGGSDRHGNDPTRYRGGEKTMNTANEVDRPNTGAVDVLVVGAGPTGLALACALLMQGVSVRVIDKAPHPATTSRANILHARGVEVLDRLGALGDLPERSVSALRVRFHVDGRLLATLRFGDVENGGGRPALVAPQAEIEAGLRRRLAELGGRIEWNTELSDATQDDDGVTAVLGDGRTVRAGWLVGSDGAHSNARKIAGIGFPGAPVAEKFILADVRADWDADRSATAGWYHRDGLLFAMPMRDGGGDDLWRLMADVPLEGKHFGEGEILDTVRRLFPERAGVEDLRIRDAVWTSNFRIHRRLADDYRRGRMLLAGDAAHIHSPTGGQGMLTGIGDAENLAWKLALVIGGRADEALLDTFEAERRPLAEEVLRGSTASVQLQTGNGPLVRFLRDRIVVPLLDKPWVQRKLTFGASQLGVTYRRGPLAPRAIPFGRRPRPGDRVEDLSCLLPDGTRTRLHAELGGRWALLAPEVSADDFVAVAGKRLGDSLMELSPLDGVSGEVMLVRPDAHLAWRGRADDSDGLERWLESALRHGRVER